MGAYSGDYGIILLALVIYIPWDCVKVIIHKNSKHTHLYMVSASTSENHTLRSGVKFSPVISSMVRSTPPDNFSPSITGIGVTGADTGPMPS